MLNRGVYTLNTHTMLIADDVAWIWFFDRQGAIQTTGVNIIQDLPYFAALLFAFQRFGVRNWGIEPSLQNSTNIFAPFEMRFPTEEGQRPLKVLINPSDKIYDQFTLNGRSTRVLAASTRSKRRDPNGLKLSNRGLVAKIYWPEESRTNEAVAIERAHDLLKDSALKRHLPTVICWIDLEHTTGDIREKLGLTDENTKSRVLRVLIAIRLEQLGSLRNEEKFLNGWKGCFECHHQLWSKGIQHGDISLWNLMWDPLRCVGVLNDFDLIQIYGEPSKGGRRTGTIAFMALDLLSLQGVPRRYKRLYRHDLESMLWVLIWICLSIEYKEDVPQGLRAFDLRRQRDQLELWKNPLTSRSTRLDVLANSHEFVACKFFGRLRNLANRFIEWFNDQKARRSKEVKPVDVVENIEETYNQIMALVKDYEDSA